MSRYLSDLANVSLPVSIASDAVIAVVETLAEILPPGWEEEDWSSNVPQGSGLPGTLNAFLTILNALAWAEPGAFRWTLAVVWKQVKRDLLHNRDPDYDSDDEEPWAYNTLRKSRFQLVVLCRCFDFVRAPGERLIRSSFSLTRCTAPQFAARL